MARTTTGKDFGEAYVTLPPHLLERVRRRVQAEGHAQPVSGYVADAVARR